MKKLFLMMGLACLFMVACNNAPKQQEQTPEEPQAEAVAPAEEHHCPFCSLKAEYAKWDEMEEAAKIELNQKACTLFAEMEARKAEMEAKGEACAQGMAEMTEEAKAECEAKCAELKAQMDAVMAQWGNFETMTLDEQKDLVLARIAAMGMGGGKCEKEGEGHHCDKPAE